MAKLEGNFGVQFIPGIGNILLNGIISVPDHYVPALIAKGCKLLEGEVVQVEEAIVGVLDQVEELTEASVADNEEAEKAPKKKPAVATASDTREA